MSDTAPEIRVVAGPSYDDLTVGDRFDGAPSVTLTDGLAAAHQAIVGDRQRLSLDAELAAAVTGTTARVAHPALVWDISIGQSTLVTQRVIANLFYRGLVFRCFPVIGDTLRTVTTVTGLRPVAAKPGRPPRGLAVLRVVTSDQSGRPVLDFHRCAMLPARKQHNTGQGEEAGPSALVNDAATLVASVRTWNLVAFRSTVPGPHFETIRPGATYRIEGGDVVSNAPELARLTLNIASVHHDRAAAAGGERLVYGGHTIGIAAAQVTRTLPSLVTFLGWHSCDHTGPVHEGDTLHAEVAVERCDPLPHGGGVAHLRARMRATHNNGAVTDVLDWRFAALFA